MGIIDKIKNRKKYDAVAEIDRDGIYSLAKQKNGKYTLLRRDKPINADLDFVTTNLRSQEISENREFLCGMKNNVMFIYDWTGEDLAPNGIEFNKDYGFVPMLFKIYKQSNKEYLVENVYAGRIAQPQYFFIYPEKKSITEPYELIEYFGREKRVTSERFGDKYYINEKGEQTSPRFVGESEKNEFDISIATIFNERHERREVLWNSKHEVVSDYCIDMVQNDAGYLGEGFYSKNGKIVSLSYFYNNEGQKYPVPVEKVSCLGSCGCVLKLYGEDAGYDLVDKDCKFTVHADWYELDERVGLILFKSNDEYYIIGKDFQNIYPVNGDVAKVVMGSLAPSVCAVENLKVVAPYAEIETTFRAFETALKKNKEYDSQEKRRGQERVEYETAEAKRREKVEEMTSSLKRVRKARDKTQLMCDILFNGFGSTVEIRECGEE